MPTLLIANRGEIAVRIARTARRMGFRVAAVYSDADAGAPHLRAADVAVRIGGAAAARSYLDIQAVLEAAEAVRADLIHPGYGFLAENADFADEARARGFTFVGPSGQAMRAVGSKSAAKDMARSVGMPVLPGFARDVGDDALLEAAAVDMGLPLMVKAAAGGGGRGMRVVESLAALGPALRSARAEALSAFGSDELLLERAVRGARHVEVQIFCDAAGQAVYLGDRDCSLQRRHQKVIEEAPAPGLSPAQRQKMGTLSCALALAVDYVGAGTVEFLVEPDGQFWFLEMNTRLQVEHGVTEAVFGVDLVEWQLRIALGQALPLSQEDLRASGHAIEARLCAEDPLAGFLPQAGRIRMLALPADTRVDHALEAGLEVTPYYDSMLAKVIAWGDERRSALTALDQALSEVRVLGLATNRSFLRQCLADPDFQAGRLDTQFLERRQPEADAQAREDALILAAIAMTVAESDGASRALRAWTNAVWRKASLTLVEGEEQARLEVGFDGTLWRVRLGERVATLFPEVLFPDQVDGWLDGRRVQARVLATSEGVEIETAQTWRRFSDHSRRARSRAHDLREQVLAAPMAGRVAQVLVKPGQAVTRGQTLIILEAMKMEHRLEARLDGVVAAVEVTEGQQVAHSARLARIEAADG